MKKTTLLCFLVSIALVSNVYSKALPKVATSTPSATVPCVGGINAQQLLQMSGMPEREFCECFPCLCCQCRGIKSVNPNNCAPCPPDEEVSKVCCQGTPKEIIVSWYCCEPEPPCPNCCDTTPCDINDCPLPYIRGSFAISVLTPVPDFSVILVLFSGIVQQYGGKTCCEEYLFQNGPNSACTNYGDQGIVNVCIDPAMEQNIKNAAQQAGITVSNFGGPVSQGCWCTAK